jgi:hypothetical protein
METKNVSVPLMVLLCLALVIIGGFMSYALFPNEKQVVVTNEVVKVERVEVPAPSNVVVPTAAEIAALVVIPAQTAQEVPSSDKINQLWEVEYNDEVYELKAKATKFILEEMNFDVSAFNLSAVVDSDTLDAQIANVSLDDLESNEDILDELEIVYDEIDEDYSVIMEDDTNVVITNLGLDEADDEKVTVSLVMKVKYNTMDNDDNVKKYIVITGEYFKDKHGDEDSKITYALKA